MGVEDLEGFSVCGIFATMVYCLLWSATIVGGVVVILGFVLSCGVGSGLEDKHYQGAWFWVVQWVCSGFFGKLHGALGVCKLKGQFAATIAIFEYYF
ncbi:hypothetical protein U1Q18_010525 [Sarracenia purpurea var. burkii]